MSSCVQCGRAIEGEHKFCPFCGSHAPETTGLGDPLIGRTLKEKYRVVSEIGSGSMGRVYLAEHVSLKKRVALKVLHPDLQVSESSLQRFQREGIAACQVSHPNAIQIFDFDQADQRTFFLAMEYVEGISLQEFIKEHSPLPPVEALELMRQILSVLDVAHKHGIVHRDLKPENIMVVGSATGARTLKVLDFGLSKLVDRPLEASLRTQTGMIVGTPLYMSPEQCSGEPVDHRADLYAAGLILYEMLTGVLPFRGRILSEILLERTSKPARAATEAGTGVDVPADLDLILRRSLETELGRRYQSAAEMLEALERADLGRLVKGIASPDGGQVFGSGSIDRTVVVRQPGSIPGRSLLLVAAGLLIAGTAVWGSLRIVEGMANGAAETPTRVSQLAVERRNETQNRYISLLEDARTALRSEDSDTALTLLEDALAMECRDSEAYLVRAMAYRMRRDLDTAVADFEAALKLDTEYVEAICGIGWVEFDRAGFDKALEAFLQALALDDGNVDALAGHGAVRRQLGEIQAADQLLARAVALDGEHAVAWYHYGLLLLEQDSLDEAIQALVQAKRNRSRHAPTYRALADAYLGKGRFQEAEDQLREVLRFQANDPDACVALATLLLEQQRFDDARTALEDVLLAAPERADLQLLLVLALRGLGNETGAIRALEVAATLEGVGTDAHMLLGILYQQQGMHAAAADQYMLVLAEDGDRVETRLNLALCQFQLGQLEPARSGLEQILYQEPENSMAHLSLGLLLMNYLDEPSLAVTHFRRYQELGGEDERVTGWLTQLDG